MNIKRMAQVQRKTSETQISLALNLDGSGIYQIDTGLKFLDHMLCALSKHAGFDLTLAAKGDIEVDDHHTVEDVAIAIGEAFDKALGERRGIVRFGYAYAPLDEALTRAVVDISSRPFAKVALGFKRETLGDVSCENLTHFWVSFATSARITLHLELLSGENDHHKAESAFKACALALKEAVRPQMDGQVPSTKGVLA
jgi:imidazoleglycerol-phosphate dehydratase